MTDPQTAADAAERVQTPAADEAARRGRALVEAFPHSAGWYLLPYEPADLLWNGNGAVHQFTLADLAALLTDRARMAAELEQVRGERADDTHAVRALTDATARLWPVPVGDLAARDTLLAAVHDRADDLFARFADRIAALGASAAPDATGDTQTGEQRADGQRDLTKAEGAQRGSQGDALCDSRVHPDFADGHDIRCTLPAGHAAHRNGTAEWTP